MHARMNLLVQQNLSKRRDSVDPKNTKRTGPTAVIVSPACANTHAMLVFVEIVLFLHSVSQAERLS